MLADDLAALQALAAAGALTPEELAVARSRAIAAFLSAPAAPPPPDQAVPVSAAPVPVGAPAPPRVTGVPSYFGKLPPRMVGVALATGAGLGAGSVAGQSDGQATVIDPAAGSQAGSPGDVGGGSFGG